jgi:hypothetical protein
MRKCRQWVGGDGFGAMTAAGGWMGGGLVTITSSAPAGTRQAGADGSRADARRLSSNCTGLLDLHERQRAMVNMKGEVRRPARHKADENVDTLPDAMYVPIAQDASSSAARAGGKKINTRLAWHTARCGQERAGHGPSARLAETNTSSSTSARRVALFVVEPARSSMPLEDAGDVCRP